MFVYVNHVARNMRAPTRRVKNDVPNEMYNITYEQLQIVRLQQR